MPSRVWRSSDLKTENTAICATKAILGHVIIGTDGTNAATIIVYDSPSAASGKVLFKQIVPGADYAGGAINLNIVADTGIYLAISGTGAEATVHYMVGDTV